MEWKDLFCFCFSSLVDLVVIWDLEFVACDGEMFLG